jgi:acetoin utilization deacetylase AcuC-like enzyme
VAAAPLPPVPLFYSDWAEVVLPGNHRFPMDKYRATRRLIEVRSGHDTQTLRPSNQHQHLRLHPPVVQEDPSLAGLFEMIRAPLASMQDLLTVHDEEYVTKYEPFLNPKGTCAQGYG